jgi:hypothetical protein
VEPPLRSLPLDPLGRPPSRIGSGSTFRYRTRSV